MDYAKQIAGSTPITLPWTMGMNDELMEQIVAYGAECARKGYEMGFGVGK
jgi:hypothetical protein